MHKAIGRVLANSAISIDLTIVLFLFFVMYEN